MSKINQKNLDSLNAATGDFSTTSQHDTVSTTSLFSECTLASSASAATVGPSPRVEFIGIKNSTGATDFDIINRKPVLIQRPTSLIEAIQQAHLIFRVPMNTYDATFNTRFEDEYLEVTEETWGAVGDKSLNLVSFKPRDASTRKSFNVEASFNIYIQTLTGKNISLQVLPSDTIFGIKEKIQVTEEIPPDEQLLIFLGMQLEDGKTLGYYKLRAEDQIHFMLNLRGSKPVIYLFPPKSISSIDVNLTLCPQWNFSAIYPLTKITTDTQGFQRVKWNVSASSNGDLVDLSSGRELSYLFWEAVSHYSPPSPSLSAIDGLTNQASTAFNPSRPILNSNNSILLPFTGFIAYLDDTLKLLTLHVSARNDFITYWLPHLIAIHEKGQFISMRFLEQVDYEKAAILDVTPVPDVITRVFMLFKGVDSDERGWEGAKERVGTIDWRTVVGIKDGSMNAEKFRVLEWGGMEVL